MINKNAVIIALGAVILVAGTAAATIYYKDQPASKPVQRVATVNTRVEQPHTVQAQPRCNDGNIAGKVVGGVGGGVAGSMVGKGKGKTAATIGGTLGGAYLGGEVLPLQNVTCP